MCLLAIRCFGIAVVLLSTTCVAAEPPPAASPNQLRARFNLLDKNRDQFLDQDEFLGQTPADTPESTSLLVRDFKLFDLDADQRLSRQEYASLPTLTLPWLRGRIADPFDDLLQQAVEALDESYDHWNERPDELVNAHTFVGNFIGSISAGGKRYVTGRILRQADHDADGRLSRAEARRFLQHQLGILWFDGPPLREHTGRLVRLDRFLEIDHNSSNSLSESEFLARWHDPDDAPQAFRIRDVDRNGTITYAEYARFDSPDYTDPIQWFRSADTNLDATLDQRELIQASDPDRIHLAKSTIPAFDDNHDQRLTLQEYRLSMHANVNYTWDHQPVDYDRDGVLSYSEFRFNDIDLFQLQRRFYFHRLDRDADGTLSPQEFPFRTQTPLTIYLRSVDADQATRQQRRLYQEREFPECGWPAISRDQRRILFHRYRPSAQQDAVIVMLTLDANMNNLGLREIGPGIKPSWSENEDQFVCERHAGGRSVWIVNLDGHGAIHVGRGHSPRWSPDGQTIAFLHDHDIVLYDVGTGKSKPILKRIDHAYGDLGQDVAWSPDSRSIAVLATRGTTSDLIIVPTSENDQPRFTVRHRFPSIVNSHINWTSNGEIMLSVPVTTGDVKHSTLSTQSMSRLVAIAAQANSPPRPIEQFPADEDWKSACMTPDGKWYIAVSGQ